MGRVWFDIEAAERNAIVMRRPGVVCMRMLMVMRCEVDVIRRVEGLILD